MDPLKNGSQTHFLNLPDNHAIFKDKPSKSKEYEVNLKTKEIVNRTFDNYENEVVRTVHLKKKISSSEKKRGEYTEITLAVPGKNQPMKCYLPNREFTDIKIDLDFQKCMEKEDDGTLIPSALDAGENQTSFVPSQLKSIAKSLNIKENQLLDILKSSEIQNIFTQNKEELIQCDKLGRWDVIADVIGNWGQDHPGADMDEKRKQVIEVIARFCTSSRKGIKHARK